VSKTLFQSIKSFPQKGKIKDLFDELKLNEGYTLLQQITTSVAEQNNIVRYTADCYSSESPLHDVWKIRTELKKAILKDYGISANGIFGEIITNENELYNEFIKWFWGQENDYYFQAIITTQEVIEQQLNVARMKINKGGGLGITEGGVATEPMKMDDDKYLKAVNIQNICLTNAIANISALEDLKTTRAKNFERTDDAVAAEAFRNSGTAERSAILAKEIRKKMNDD
jgi:hypothetical protein